VDHKQIDRIPREEHDFRIDGRISASPMTEISCRDYWLRSHDMDIYRQNRVVASEDFDFGPHRVVNVAASTHCCREAYELAYAILLHGAEE